MNGIQERAGAGIGRGIYSYPQASALLMVSRNKVARWADGYTFPRKHDRGISAPVLQTQRKAKGVISFAELIELFFVHEYTNYGIPLAHVRRTAQALAPDLGPFPFASAKLKTDGRYLLREVDGVLIKPDVQQLMCEFAAEFLHDVEFEQGIARIYRPKAGRGAVVIDARKLFGAPFVEGSGVPTGAIYDLFKAEQDFDAVASWFEVPVESVRNAVEFEASCRRAA